MRRAARIDANQVEIVAALRKAGAVVTHMHTLGGGVSDLLVSFRQKWIVIEVKSDLQAPSKQRLTTDEKRWIGQQRAPVYIVKNPMDALFTLTVATK